MRSAFPDFKISRLARGHRVDEIFQADRKATIGECGLTAGLTAGLAAGRWA